jgi:hypothetical protein
MKIYFRPLSKGEIYCCSLKSAKDLFKNTAVKLNFTYGGREFSKGLQHPIYRYAKRNVKGKVIAYTTISLREESPLLNFFELKESEYPQELREEFETKLLPEFYRIYNLCLENQSLVADTVLALVEMFDNKLILHKKNIKY